MFMTLASTLIVFFIVFAHVPSLLWQFKDSIYMYLMGKVDIGFFFCVTADILTKSFTEMFLE